MIHIELGENNMLYIGDDTSSGCKYVVETKQDIIDAITDYINNYTKFGKERE